MSLPACIRYQRDDLSAGVCFYCVPSIAEARTTAQELEDRGWSVNLGVCPPCRKRHAMDSMKGTPWALGT